MFDATKIKSDFPILNRKIHKNRLVYLDNAATSQKPTQVLEAINDYYLMHNANVHRGVHTLSEEATDMYEAARITVAKFIGAKSPTEIIFTKGTTESINRVAFSFLTQHISKDDEIMVVESDHHSNIVPWQIVARSLEAKLVVLTVNAQGEFDLNDFRSKISPKTKFIAVSHVSNVLGTIFPVKEICSIARKLGIIVSVDGAQAVPHFSVNVESLGCDFYSFSGHKMLGPMGIGVLWGRKEILEGMNPYEYGGGMIKAVALESSTWDEVPQRFEAGTPNVEGAVGLAAAINYMNELGMKTIASHDKELTEYAIKSLSEIDGLTVLGPANLGKRCGVVSFVVKGIHAHDLAAVLSDFGIAVRSGQHCTMPLHIKLGISSSTRASFQVYNTKEDIDSLVEGIEQARKILL